MYGIALYAAYVWYVYSVRSIVQVYYTVTYSIPSPFESGSLAEARLNLMVHYISRLIVPLSSLSGLKGHDHLPARQVGRTIKVNGQTVESVGLRR